MGCLSRWYDDTPTNVRVVEGSTLGTTLVNPPLTMWAQVIQVEYSASDLSLFTTSTSSVVSSSPTASPSQTSNGLSQTGSVSTGMSTLTSVPAATPGPAGLAAGAIAGIVIGALIGLALVVGLTIFCTLRRTRAKKSEITTPSTDEKPASATDLGDPREPRELPTVGYGKSIRRAEAPTDSPRYELPAERAPAEAPGERDPAEIPTQKDSIKVSDVPGRVELY
jgi:hypothetical protein